MEYDFEVAAGADPRQISLLIEGADAMEVDASGDLVISTLAGPMRQRRPAVYQEVEGARREVESGYSVEPGGRVRFALGEYDASAPLVIDPVLENSTYLGGGDWDGAKGIAIDASRNAYVTGYTFSTDFPTKNPIQGTNAAPTNFTDVFVTKLNATGSALVYSTYLGGSGNDDATDIAVDSSGNAYVAGSTDSTNFPTANSIQSTMAGDFDAFVTKLNAAGSAFVYSTYLGGNNTDEGNGIAADSQGSAYVAGQTKSTNFPVAFALQGTNAFGYDAFVTKISVLPSIRGRVLNGAGAGVPGVTVKLTGSLGLTRTTNANGEYGFFGLPQGGDYTVTPTKTDCDGQVCDRERHGSRWHGLHCAGSDDTHVHAGADQQARHRAGQG